MLNSMRVMFRRQYDLYLANSGPEALKILAVSDIDVVVCDHRMPQMTGVEVLTRARELSPRSIRILLTGYADLDAVEGSINEGEVFRFLTKPCAPSELKETVRLAAGLALESQPVAPASPKLAEVPEANIKIVERAAAVPALAVGQGGAANEPALGKGAAVLVFSTDDSISALATSATRGLVPVYQATSIGQVVEILTEFRPGVLLTDISEDRATIQTMTARLKQHLPELVTIAVSEHRDILDMVWLINHGQIFRFLRKPLTRGRCAVSLKAALKHHQNLLQNPGLTKRYTVESTTQAESAQGVLARLSFLRKLWSTT